MRICTKPKVYLVARSSLASGVWEFLREQSLEWPTESLNREPYTGTDGNPTDTEQLTELAGRCCYMSFGSKAGSKTNAAYLENLIYGGKPPRAPEEILEDLGTAMQVVSSNVEPHSWTSVNDLYDELQKSIVAQRRPAHGSVLEHATFSFLVVGAGRGFSHEQVRHRAGWAYSQLSTRYCDFERSEKADGTWDPGFTIPPLGQLSNDATSVIEGSHQAARATYHNLLLVIERDLQANSKFVAQLEKLPEKERKRTLRKAARGAARDVLPNGTEAIMVMTANARAIWNTIALRANEAAEGEIRAVYVQIARIMEWEMPNVFKGLKYVELWDGSQAVVMPRDKL